MVRTSLIVKFLAAFSSKITESGNALLTLNVSSIHFCQSVKFVVIAVANRQTEYLQQAKI